MNERDYQLILHIKKHCEDISDFIEQGGAYSSFITNQMYFNAVTMSLLQIGELAKHFSDKFIEDTKQIIPWNKIRGLRNIVAHGYDSLDKEIVWNVSNDYIDDLFVFCKEKSDEYKKAVSKKNEKIR